MRSEGGNQTVRLVIGGAFVVGLTFAGLGVVLVLLDGQGYSTITFAGLSIRSSSVGVAAIGMGVATVIALVGRALRSHDSALVRRERAARPVVSEHSSLSGGSQRGAPTGATSSSTFYSCHITFSPVDDEFVTRLNRDLRAAGVRTWFAPEDLDIGQRQLDAVSESIRSRDRVLLIISKSSIESRSVEEEVELALDRERVHRQTILVPIRLDDQLLKSSVGWAGLLRSARGIGDFAAWKDNGAYDRAFDRLLRNLVSKGITDREAS